jgi:hypothetical protein
MHYVQRTFNLRKIHNKGQVRYRIKTKNSNEEDIGREKERKKKKASCKQKKACELNVFLKWFAFQISISIADSF